MMQWRQECVVKPVRDAYGHVLEREEGGYRCRACGRTGRSPKQVRCGRAHRGRVIGKGEVGTLGNLLGWKVVGKKGPPPPETKGRALQEKAEK